MAGKVILITGATDGIGKVTALELARGGATVVGVGRSAPKCEATAHEISAATGNPNVAFLVADLSSLHEVRRVAADFQSRYNRLDVLINNAGGIFWSYGETVDGFERTFALNHLAYFVLTMELLDLLRAGAPSRIVNVSSGAHNSGVITFDNLQRTGYGSADSFAVYSQSKLANVLFSNELARRLAGTGVTSNALHPGFVRTRFGRSGARLLGGGVGLLQQAFAISPEEGAKTTIYLATSPDVEGVTGRYFVKSRAATPHARALDTEAARRLWQVSEELVAQASASHVTA